MHSDDLNIRDALEQHYAKHGLPPDGGMNQSWFVIRVGPLRIPALNPGIRKRAVLAHDVHHLVTGYNTAFSDGEMIIAGHELGCGCGRFLFAWLVNCWMFALGVFITPRKMFAAFVRGRRCDSVYHLDDCQLKQLTMMRLGELKERVGLDQPTAPATMRDRALFAMWGVIAWTVLLTCAALPAVPIWFAIAVALSG